MAHKFLETVFGVRQKVLNEANKKEYMAGLPGMPLIEKRNSSVNNNLVTLTKRSFTKQGTIRGGSSNAASQGKKLTLTTKRSSMYTQKNLPSYGEEKELKRVDSSGTDSRASRSRHSRSRNSVSVTPSRSRIMHDFSALDDGLEEENLVPRATSPTKELRRKTISISLVEQKLSPERQAIHKQIGGRII